MSKTISLLPEAPGTLRVRGYTVGSNNFGSVDRTGNEVPGRVYFDPVDGERWFANGCREGRQVLGQLGFVAWVCQSKMPPGVIAIGRFAGTEQVTSALPGPLADRNHALVGSDWVHWSQACNDNSGFVDAVPLNAHFAQAPSQLAWVRPRGDSFGPNAGDVTFAWTGVMIVPSEEATAATVAMAMAPRRTRRTFRTPRTRWMERVLTMCFSLVVGKEKH